MQKQLGAVVEELAPQKVLVLRDRHVGLEAVVVVDNVACGPALGASEWPTMSLSGKWPDWPGP